MAIRKIITSEDEQLRKKSREVTNFDSRLHTLLDDMKDTLIEAKGVGLAAPQVGVLRRVVIIIVDDVLYELINPEILKTAGEQVEGEGCLSCPGVYGLTNRPKKVSIKAYNRYGKPIKLVGQDLLAKAISHEVDHLNGILFIDNMIRPLTPEELAEDK